MLKLEITDQKAILTVYGDVGGYYLDAISISVILDKIKSIGLKKVDCHIHTFGGSVFDGNLLFLFIENFEGEFDIYVDGVLASMGPIFASAAHKVYIAENGFIMVHPPSVMVRGTAKDLTAAAGLLTSMQNSFKTRLMKKTGKSETEIDALLDGTDHWFDADQAIEYGLADEKFGKVVEIKAIEVETDSGGCSSIEDCPEDKCKAYYKEFQAKLENQFQEEMDKKTLIARYSLSLAESATDEQVMAAIDQKLAGAQASAKAIEKTAIASAVDGAIAAGKLPKEKRDAYVAKGEKFGLEELNSIFSDMPSASAGQTPQKQTPPRVIEMTRGGQPSASLGGGSEDRSTWGWKDYVKNDMAALEAMAKIKDPAFIAIYKAEFGVEPK